MRKDSIDNIIDSIRDYIEYIINTDELSISDYYEFLVSITERLERIKK
ncbi:MAG: hypothetical protein ACP5U0_07450 [Caldisphaera sp.]